MPRFNTEGSAEDGDVAVAEVVNVVADDAAIEEAPVPACSCGRGD